MRTRPTVLIFLAGADFASSNCTTEKKKVNGDQGFWIDQKEYISDLEKIIELDPAKMKGDISRKT